MTNDDICYFCKKTATKLCDFPLGYPHFAGHTPRGLEVYDADGDEITADIATRCSRPMCDDCATKIFEHGEIDFCPFCINIMDEAIKKQKWDRAVIHKPKRR